MTPTDRLCGLGCVTCHHRAVTTRRIPTVAALVALVLVLAGCTKSTAGAAQSAPTSAAVPSLTPSPSPAGDPQTIEAAKAAAQLGWDRYVGGDYAGVWDLY